MPARAPCVRRDARGLRGKHSKVFVYSIFVCHLYVVE